MKSDLGFEYIQQLCDAIEMYTRQTELKDPKAFYHRGANLKYAVERDLYFSSVNNNRLCSLFAQCKAGRPLKVTEVNSEVERRLALHLCGSALSPGQVRVRKYSGFHPRGAWHALRRHAHAWKQRRLIRKTNPTTPAKEVRVLFHVIHEKFVGYLNPITAHLRIRFAYLLALDSSIKGCLNQHGVHFIDATGLVDTSHDGKSEVIGEYPIHCYNRFHAGLAQLRPECVVVVEGNTLQDELINQACRQLAIPTVCLQQGWSPFVHNGFRNMSYTRMLVWGEGFIELLKPCNPNQEFIAVGNHVLDAGLRKASSSEAPPPLAVATKRSGVVGKVVASPKRVAFFLQAPGRLITQSAWDDLLKLIKWIADQFRDVAVLVREHPAHALSDHERAEITRFSVVSMMPPSEYSLAQVLNGCCMSVSIYSSTILESIGSGVFPLIFNPTSLPVYFPDVHAAGAGIEVKTLDEAMQVIRRVLANETYLEQFRPGIEQFRKKFFYQDHRQPVDRIAEEITSICK